MDVLPSLLPVGVGVLILGVFCSLLLARSLTRPLKEITAAVRLVADVPRARLAAVVRGRSHYLAP